MENKDKLEKVSGGGIFTGIKRYFARKSVSRKADKFVDDHSNMPDFAKGIVKNRKIHGAIAKRMVK